MKTSYELATAHRKALAFVLAGVALFLSSIPVQAQNPVVPGQQDQVAAKQFVMVPQTPVAQVTGVTVAPSQPGPAIYYYWVVTILAGNYSYPAGPFQVTGAPTTLSASAYNTVSWAPVTSGIYDLLRTATTTPPTGACACAVAIAITGSAQKDVANALNAYTVTVPAWPLGYPVDGDLAEFGTDATGQRGALVDGGSFLSQFGSPAANLIFASPNGSAGPPSFRAMAGADIPATTSNCVNQFATGLNAGFTPICATPPVFVGAGVGHAIGYVPDPGVTSHNPAYYLGDDGGFHVLTAGGGGTGALGTTCNANGCYMVLGGTLLQWGISAVPTFACSNVCGTSPVTFPIPFATKVQAIHANSNTCDNGTCGAGRHPISSTPESSSVSGFTVYFDGNGATISGSGVQAYWVAVGDSSTGNSGTGNLGANVFNVKNFGAYGDTQAQVTGCSWPSQNSISCTGYNFTSVDVGKNVQQYVAVGVFNEATIATVSGGAVTGVTGASYSGASAGWAPLLFGHIDDAAGPIISALLNAIFAANAQDSNGVGYNFGSANNALTVYFPAGGYTLCGTNAVPEFLALSPTVGHAAFVNIVGDPGATILYPCGNVPTAPPFNSQWLVANTTGGYAGASYQNLAFNGLGVNFSSHYGGIFTDAYNYNNVTCQNLQYHSTNAMSCINAQTTTQAYNVTASYNGNGCGIGINGGNIEFHQSRTSNNYDSGVCLTNVTGAPGSAGFRWIGGQIDESGCTDGGSYIGNVNILNSYDAWFVDTGIFSCTNAGYFGVYVDPTSVAHLNGDVIGPFSAGGGLEVAAGGKVIATDTLFYTFNSATFNCVNNLGTFVNLGGNRCQESFAATASEASNTVTLTTAQNHRLTNANIGDWISVGSMTPTGYNCPAGVGGASAGGGPPCFQIIAVPAANTLQYTSPNAGLSAGTGGTVYISTWNGGAFAGNPPQSDLTPTWNTCYITASPFAGATMCSQPNDRAQYMMRVRATSGVATVCAIPPVLTITNGNVTTSFTLTSAQSVWDSSTSSSTFPIASGAMPMYFAPTLPSGANSPTMSVTTGTCATPPTNFSVTMYGTSPGLP